MLSARLILLAMLAYGLVGLAFALIFVAAGITRVDPAARGSGPAFRLLMLPGAAALWPVMGARWKQVTRQNQSSAPNPQSKKEGP